MLNKNAKDDNTDDGFIQVHLDQTDLQKTTFMHRKLYEIFKNFAEELMIECGLSKRLGSSSIVFETLFGKLDFDFQNTIVPGFILG